MFVIIILSIGSKPFPPSVTNIKRIVNFCFYPRFWTTYNVNKKAHD